MKKLSNSLIVAACFVFCNFAFCQDGQPPTKLKPDFKVLYSNDTTNISVSPLRHKEGVTFEELFRLTINEVAEKGVDVHLLQPACTWAPLWKSKIYSADEHIQWLKEKHPDRKFDRMMNYIAGGGDVLALFVSECKNKGMEPFISIRLNHTASNPIYLSKFYDDNPQFLTGPWQPWITSQNWAFKEVRDHRLAIIKEICENYDISGLELDFLRYPIFFDNWKSYYPLEKRLAVMNEFITDVRNILNETQIGQKHRWLAVRVPHKLIAHSDIGINLIDFVNRGVEMVTLSSYYFTNQDTDLKVIRSLIPDAAVYLEITYANSRGRADVSSYRHYTSRYQATTTANIAYQQGADGVSLFNFAYYRFLSQEPPFDVIGQLKDSHRLKDMPSWYFIDALENHYHGSPAVNYALPRTLKKNDVFRLTKQIYPQDKHSATALLRIRGDIELGGSDITVSVNNNILKRTEFVEPLKHGYPKDMDFDKPQLWACFTIEKEDLFYGQNAIKVILNEGEAFTIRYIDIILPTD